MREPYFQLINVLFMLARLKNYKDLNMSTIARLLTWIKFIMIKLTVLLTFALFGSIMASFVSCIHS